MSPLTPVVYPLFPPLFPLVCSSRRMTLLHSLTLLGIFPLQGKMASISFPLLPSDCKASWCILSLILRFGSVRFPVRPTVWLRRSRPALLRPLKYSTFQSPAWNEESRLTLSWRWSRKTRNSLFPPPVSESLLADKFDEYGYTFLAPR